MGLFLLTVFLGLCSDIYSPLSALTLPEQYSVLQGFWAPVSMVLNHGPRFFVSSNSSPVALQNTSSSWSWFIVLLQNAEDCSLLHREDQMLFCFTSLKILAHLSGLFGHGVNKDAFSRMPLSLKDAIDRDLLRKVKHCNSLRGGKKVKDLYWIFKHQG